jgi:hypothetical protein
MALWKLTIALFVALLPTSAALAAGRGGAPQGAVGSPLGGASGYGAQVGGGAPAGAVGGGAPAGLIGGGIAPTNTNPASSSGSGAPLSPTAGEAPAAYPGVPPASNIPGGGPPPDSADGSSPSGAGAEQAQRTQQGPIAVPKLVGGVAEEPSPATGFAVLAADGVSTRFVAARPCGLAAHETDGTSTCVGIPKR